MPRLASNKKALFDYEILEKFETGIILSGPEVKAVKNQQINLKGSYVNITEGEAFLVNAHISAYKPASKQQTDYSPTQKRKLLLHKKELERLYGKITNSGLTIVPISVYTKNNLIKVEIGLAKGKKQFEKRETLKKRSIDKRIRETLKN